MRTARALHAWGRAIFAIAACCLVLTTGACAAEQAASALARVERVDDGDTLRVVMNGETVRVRIFGIDAPELDQPYGREALDAARRLLTDRTIGVVPRDTDPYGRLVASLTLDGRDVGQELVRAGAAWHFTQFSNSPAMAAAERDARAARRGLWGTSNPTPPWQHRTDQRVDGAGRSGEPLRPRVTTVAGAYHGNVSSKVFHARGCPQFDCANCTVGFESTADAHTAGYRPHAACVRP